MKKVLLSAIMIFVVVGFALAAPLGNGITTTIVITSYIIIPVELALISPFILIETAVLTGTAVSIVR